MDIYSVVHQGGAAPYAVIAHRPDGTGYIAARGYGSRLAADQMCEWLTARARDGEPVAADGYCPQCWCEMPAANPSARFTVTVTVAPVEGSPFAAAIHQGYGGEWLTAYLRRYMPAGSPVTVNGATMEV